MPEEAKQENVPYFVHEGMMARMENNNKNALDKMGESNKRMENALRTVCITLIVVVLLFVAGYTINNRNWISYVEQLQNLTEDRDAGIHQQSDSGNYQRVYSFRA